MSEPEPEYDAATCITAAEARASGIEVPETVPDVAWIPRSSIRVELGDVTADIEGKRFNATFAIHFSEPWRWIHFRMEIEKKER